MNNSLLLILVTALFLFASHMDLQDAEREEAALAAHWAMIAEANQ